MADEKVQGSNTAAALGIIGLGLDMWSANQARNYNQEMERYRNDMRKIQEAHVQNSITTKEVYASLDTKRRSIANEIEYLDAAGTFAVKTAISQFSGRTARAVGNAKLRAKQLRQANIEDSYDRSRRATDLQRLNSAFSLQVSLEDGYVEPVNYAGMIGDYVQNSGENLVKVLAGA